MIDYKEKNNGDSLNQSESDDAFWIENKIKELNRPSSNDYNSAVQSPDLSLHSRSQSEESYKVFEGFGGPFFNPTNFNSLPENQPALPPGLGPVDQGFSRDPFTRNKAESQEQSFPLFSGPLNASELFKVPQSQMPKHSRFSHYEPEPTKATLKSRLKLQSAKFQPDHDAGPQGEHQDEECDENDSNEENVEIKNLENKIESKEILQETPEKKETNKTPEQEEKNLYAAGSLPSKREIEERKRKQAAEAEAEAAAKKIKAPEVVVVHTKPADETPNHEHKNEKVESKNILETPKNAQNKIPKPIIKQEPHSQHQQTKPHLQHHENNGVTKQQSFKKEDSFKQATKHKKRASFQQEKEVFEYVEKKNLPAKQKEEIETKPKLAGVNKFNKFEFLIGSQSSASNSSNDSLDENLEVNEVKKGSNSPKKPESKSVIPEKDNDQQGSNKKKNKKKQKNKNKTLTSNKDLDSTPKEIKEIDVIVKSPSSEPLEEEKGQSDEEVEKQQQNKPSSKSAKNKKKKANKKKKKNASSIQALEDDKEIMKGVHLRENADSDLSQISEIEQETLSQNAKKKTLREICEDPRMISSGLLFIPGSNFYDDLLKGMKLIPR